MAIDTPFMFKTQLGNTDLSLSASTGEAFRVVGVRVYNSAGNFASIYVDNTMCGYWRVSSTGMGNHLHFPIQNDEKLNLMERLVQGGLFRPIPVPEGSTFTITGVAQAGAVQQVVYTVHRPNEVRGTDPNGPQASEYDYIAYGTHSGNLTAGDNELDQASNPAQYPEFPYEKDVPAHYTMQLFGICFSEFAQSSTTAGAGDYTTFVKLIQDRVTLFDEDNNGIYCRGYLVSGAYTLGRGQSNMGYFSDTDERMPMMLPTPMVFGPGEELDIFVTTATQASGSTISGGQFDMGLIMRATRSR